MYKVRRQGWVEKRTYKPVPGLLGNSTCGILLDVQIATEQEQGHTYRVVETAVLRRNGHGLCAFATRPGNYVLQQGELLVRMDNLQTHPNNHIYQLNLGSLPNGVQFDHVGMNTERYKGPGKELSRS